MNNKRSRVILGCYDLILAAGAIYNGSKMALGSFWGGEFPNEWIGKIPFTSWFYPGIIAILVYGLGNLIAAYFSFSKKKKGWIISLVMGGFFFLSLLLSIKILGEVYLPTGMFIILSIIQMLLAGIAGIIYFRRTEDEKNF